MHHFKVAVGTVPTVGLTGAHVACDGKRASGRRSRVHLKTAGDQPRPSGRGPQQTRFSVDESVTAVDSQKVGFNLPSSTDPPGFAHKGPDVLSFCAGMGSAHKVGLPECQASIAFGCTRAGSRRTGRRLS
jgi:hypothetical protein